VAAQVFATSPLGVIIDGASEGSGDPASLASPLLDSAIVPVIEDQAAGIGTGVIILNSATESSLKLTVHDAEGRERDNLFRGSRQFELPAYGHRVVFFRELYPDLGDFRGTVTVDGGTDRPQEGGPIAVVALERGPGGALAGTAAPSLSPVSPTGPSYLAGVTAGGDRRAAVLVVNPSINRRAVGTVRFFDGTGRPWPVVAGAQGPTDTASFDLSQTAMVMFDLRAGGSLEHGSARIETTQGTAAARHRDASAGSVTHVASTAAAPGFIMPAVRNTAQGTSTRVSVSSAGSAVTLELTLRTSAGTAIAGGTLELQLPANGQLTRALEELFPSAATDSFDGTLTVEATGGAIAVHAALMSASRRSVLPVLRIQ
jgi:hypothetical protein